MSLKEIDKKTIESLLPHREPMLLIDKLINIVPLKSATAIMYVKKDGFYVQGHFPGLIVTYSRIVFFLPIYKLFFSFLNFRSCG